MGQPARITWPGGWPVLIPVGTASAVAIRTTSTPPASPSTRTWHSAEIVFRQPARSTTVELDDKIVNWLDLSPEWHAHAKCSTSSPKDADETFFGETEDHTRTSMTISKIREVKEFCRSCPVFAECLTHALSTPERHGIWAGTSKRTRLRILAMIDAGLTTIGIVVQDYLEGRERQYESIRRRT